MFWKAAYSGNSRVSDLFTYTYWNKNMFTPFQLKFLFAQPIHGRNTGLWHFWLQLLLYLIVPLACYCSQWLQGWCWTQPPHINTSLRSPNLAPYSCWCMWQRPKSQSCKTWQVQSPAVAGGTAFCPHIAAEKSIPRLSDPISNSGMKPLPRQSTCDWYLPRTSSGFLNKRRQNWIW